MIAVEELALELGTSGACEEKAGTTWFQPEQVDVRAVAALMKSNEARLVTIAATELADGAGIRLDYHWDLDGRLVSIVTKADGGRIQTISDICEAADWVEREIRDYFAIEFEGRESEPLMLRRGDTPGVNLRGDDE